MSIKYGSSLVQIIEICRHEASRQWAVSRKKKKLHRNVIIFKRSSFGFLYNKLAIYGAATSEYNFRFILFVLFIFFRNAIH